jgi:hypothetical protein
MYEAVLRLLADWRPRVEGLVQAMGRVGPHARAALIKDLPEWEEENRGRIEELADRHLRPLDAADPAAAESVFRLTGGGMAPGRRVRLGGLADAAALSDLWTEAARLGRGLEALEDMVAAEGAGRGAGAARPGPEARPADPDHPARPAMSTRIFGLPGGAQERIGRLGAMEDRLGPLGREILRHELPAWVESGRGRLGALKERHLVEVADPELFEAVARRTGVRPFFPGRLKDLDDEADLRRVWLEASEIDRGLASIERVPEADAALWAGDPSIPAPDRPPPGFGPGRLPGGSDGDMARGVLQLPGLYPERIAALRDPGRPMIHGLRRSVLADLDRWEAANLGRLDFLRDRHLAPVGPRPGPRPDGTGSDGPGPDGPGPDGAGRTGGPVRFKLKDLAESADLERLWTELAAIGGGLARLERLAGAGAGPGPADGPARSAIDPGEAHTDGILNLLVHHPARLARLRAPGPPMEPGLGRRLQERLERREAANLRRLGELRDRHVVAGETDYGLPAAALEQLGLPAAPRHRLVGLDGPAALGGLWADVAETALAPSELELVTAFGRGGHLREPRVRLGLKTVLGTLGLMVNHGQRAAGVRGRVGRVSPGFRRRLLEGLELREAARLRRLEVLRRRHVEGLGEAPEPPRSALLAAGVPAASARARYRGLDGPGALERLWEELDEIDGGLARLEGLAASWAPDRPPGPPAPGRLN